MGHLPIITGYVGLAIISLFSLNIIWHMFTGKIDLTLLVSEADGTASMSRFQLLIFTIVIAFGLVMIIVNTKKFPDGIDASVMGLLGLSGGTYLVSKGVQKSGQAGAANPKASATNQQATSDQNSAKWISD